MECGFDHNKPGFGCGAEAYIWEPDLFALWEGVPTKCQWCDGKGVGCLHCKGTGKWRKYS